MEEIADECKHCDHCKQPFAVTRTKVICSTCKAIFCTSKCKKVAKKEHKKCSGRPHFEPPKPEIVPPPEEKLVIENDEIRRLLFGPDNEYKCGYHDDNNVLQPATTPERAIEILATHYQRLRVFYISKIPEDETLRAIGNLSFHFDDFIELAKAYLTNKPTNVPIWIPFTDEMIEKVKDLELGKEYFALTFTIGPKDGPFVINRTIRFLYNWTVE